MYANGVVFTYFSFVLNMFKCLKINGFVKKIVVTVLFVTLICVTKGVFYCYYAVGVYIKNLLIDKIYYQFSNTEWVIVICLTLYGII